MGVDDGGRGHRRRAPTRPPPTSPRNHGLRRRASAWREARTAEDVAAGTSRVAWVCMTEDAVADDELRRDRPRRAPGIADSGDELPRGVRHGRGRRGRGNEPGVGSDTEDAADSDVSSPSSLAVDPAVSPGPHPIHLLLRGSKETRRGAKSLLTWSWLAVECGRIIFYMNRMIPNRYLPIPAMYQDLIHRKHHPPRGKNRMISDRYHLIPRKYHLIRGRNA
uniref:Uncharacterized protein n=1 Tax=Oryza barthii TaxID=65489 RepID=A0A0D3H5N8_9ORYZ